MNMLYNICSNPWCKGTFTFPESDIVELPDGSKSGPKQCPKCESIKSLDEFHKKTDDYYHSYCKTCLYKLQKERWKDRKQKAIELMGGKCNSCGYNK